MSKGYTKQFIAKADYIDPVLKFLSTQGEFRVNTKGQCFDRFGFAFQIDGKAVFLKVGAK